MKDKGVAMFTDAKPFRVDDSPVQASVVGQNTAVRVYKCDTDDIDVAGWLTANQEQILRQLREFGVILFRGFNVDTIAGLREFAMTFTPELVPYKERRSPRTDLGGNIYTSTIHPADQEIHFHNTTSFSHQW